MPTEKMGHLVVHQIQIKKVQCSGREKWGWGGSFWKTQALSRIPLMIHMFMCKTKQKILAWRWWEQSRLKQDGVKERFSFSLFLICLYLYHLYLYLYLYLSICLYYICVSLYIYHCFQRNIIWSVKIQVTIYFHGWAQSLF